MDKLTITIILAAANLLTACATYDPDANMYPDLRAAALNAVTQYTAEVKASSAKDGEEKTFAAAQAAAKRLLKDPDSATFRSLRISKYNGFEVVCGEINAKNSYGGYVGYNKFVAGTTGATIFATDTEYPDIADAENTGIGAACNDADQSGK